MLPSFRHNCLHWCAVFVFVLNYNCFWRELFLQKTRKNYFFFKTNQFHCGVHSDIIVVSLFLWLCICVVKSGAMFSLLELQKNFTGQIKILVLIMSCWLSLALMICFPTWSQVFQKSLHSYLNNNIWSNLSLYAWLPFAFFSSARVVTRFLSLSLFITCLKKSRWSTYACSNTFVVFIGFLKC